MSYPVRVVVKESVSEVVSSSDAVQLPLTPDPILDKPRCQEILRQTLIDGGWAPTCDEHILVKPIPGTSVEMVWDLKNQRVVVQAKAEATVTAEQETTLHGDIHDASQAAQERVAEDLRKRGKEVVKKQAQEKLAAQRAAKEAEQLAKIQRELTAGIEPAKEEINKALEGVYREWLLEQAKTLGDVTGKHESVGPDGTYELVIKIRN